MRKTLLCRRLAGGAAALAAVASTPLVARAQTTINFAANACSGRSGGNTSSGYNSYGTPFDVQGFRFANASTSASGFGTACSGSVYYAGTTGLFDNTGGDVTVLTRTSGAAFSISSIDLAGLYSGSAQSVTFIGALAGGGTVSQIFAIPASGLYPASASAFTMFTFAPTFTNLASLSFAAQTEPYYQFTNVRLDQAAAAVVPEPGTWALLGTGLLGIGGAALRRRSAPTA